MTAEVAETGESWLSFGGLNLKNFIYLYLGLTRFSIYVHISKL